MRIGGTYGVSLSGTNRVSGGAAWRSAGAWDARSIWVRQTESKAPAVRAAMMGIPPSFECLLYEGSAEETLVTAVIEAIVGLSEARFLTPAKRSINPGCLSYGPPSSELF